MRVSPITRPLPREHLSATAPLLVPEVDAAWRRRLNFWTGRPLTYEALQVEQEERAARLAWRGRQVTAGIVRGLEVTLELIPGRPAESVAPTLQDYRVHLLPGHGIAETGEDVVLPRAITAGLSTVPVRRYDAQGAVQPLRPGLLPFLANDANENVELVQAWRTDLIAAGQPWAAVLLLEPAVLINVDRQMPNDPCEIDPDKDAFADPRLQDAARLRFCLLPAADLPASVLPDVPFNRSWRNRLAAHLIGRELTGAAGAAAWRSLGVPLAVVSFQPGAVANTFRPFVDMASVTRTGGRVRFRSRPGPLAGNPPARLPADLWQQRYTQFLEQVSQLPLAVVTDALQLAQHFRTIPPAGLLPSAALDILATPAQPSPIPDRASVSHFFPANWRVEAAPIPVEDLDAALAGSVSLAPLTLATSGEIVRILVPVPQRVFDPALLVIALPDARIEAERRRLVAIRQDWRQRRDWVLGRRDDLHQLIIGPVGSPLPPPAEPPNLDPEPVETPARVGFSVALIPPQSGGVEARLTVAFVAQSLINAANLFLELRLDPEFPPSSVVVRWRAGVTQGIKTYPVPPPPLPARTGPQGEELDTPMWLRYTATPTELGLPINTPVVEFTLEIRGGNVAVGRAGVFRTGNPVVPEIWWQPGQGNPVGTPAPWLEMGFERLYAPFEDRFKPVFPDRSNFEDRLKQIRQDARIGGPIEGRGLMPLLTDLEAQVDRADDLISLGFYKTQAHIHRIRQVMLGEDAANDLLTSPSLNNVVKTKSSRISQERLTQIFLAANRNPDARVGIVGAVPFENIRGAAGAFTNAVNVSTVASPAVQARTTTFAKAFQAATKEDVLGAEAIVGQSPPVRSVTIGKRFESGPVNDAFNNALAGLREVALLVRTLAFRYADTEVFPRTVMGSGPVQNGLFPAARFRDFASDPAFPLTLLAIGQNDNPALTLAHALSLTDASASILRRLEFYVAELRALADRVRETMNAASAQRDLALGRLATIEARLAEARHDVAVARALQQEDRDQVNALNQRRDQVLREHVKFLAYVRPRNFDGALRITPEWDLDVAGSPPPVPECLRRHDDPPDPLEGYVRLFRHAPARWFVTIGPRLREFVTRERLVELLQYTRLSASRFESERSSWVDGAIPAAVRAVYLGGFGALSQIRQRAATLGIASANVKSWTEHHRDVEEHVALGDLIDGRHANGKLASDASAELNQIQQVATCLHAEFAAVSPAVRLRWVEQFSEFDQAVSFRDLTVLPGFGQIERHTRRRLQAFVDWAYGRVALAQNGAEALINDLVRLCLLLASHAPVDRIISGHLPQITPVRPGMRIPIRAVEPARVHVGMAFQVWQGTALVARGRVADLHDGEVAATVEHTVVAQLQTTMRVQFIPAGFQSTG